MIDTIKKIIDKFELGYVFTVSDFPITAENAKTIDKILNDFVAIGYLRKLSKGRKTKTITNSPLITELLKLWEDLRSTYQSELTSLAYSGIPNNKLIEESFVATIKIPI